MSEKNITHKKLLKSGFPFQLRIEREIASNGAQHSWQIIGSEQVWHNPHSNKHGFIDIVLQHGQLVTLKMVLECKRVKSDDAQSVEWVFIIPEEDPKEENLVRCLSVESYVSKDENGESRILRAWDDVRIFPESLESNFCVLHGDEPGRTSLLENICSSLLNATEGLLEEELNICSLPETRNHLRAFYFPVIVTNAKLKVCLLDPSSVSIEDGTILEENYSVKTVPFLRFRKSLATEFSLDDNVLSLRDSNLARERTVFIVNSENLVQFLSGWNIGPMDSFDGYKIQRLRN